MSPKCCPDSPAAGSYVPQAALQEASSLDHRLPENLKQEKMEFVYRSHIGLKDYDVPLSEIKDGAPTGELRGQRGGRVQLADERAVVRDRSEIGC